jgi:hypothetical protein
MPEVSSAPAPARGSVLDASAVLLLLSDGPAGGTAIVIASPSAPSFVVLGDDTEEGFARLRRGAIAYGSPETYRALPRDMVSHDDRVLRVVPERFRRAIVDRSGSLFGTTAEKLLLPISEGGKPFERVRVPIPSLETPAYVEFAFDGGTGDGMHYRLDGAARQREGYICSYCGKLCPSPEPHTASHGVAGHLKAGVMAGQDDDEVHGHPGSSPDHSSQGPRQ